MRKALKILKDTKGHPTMVNDIIETNFCDSSKDGCIQNTCKDCQFDNIYSQFKDEGNSSGENSGTSNDDEIQESDVDEYFATYQRWVQQEGKTRKRFLSRKTSSKYYGKNVMLLKKHIHGEHKQVAILVYFFLLYFLKKDFASTRQI